MVKDGIVLGKRYAVLSKIGAGGMADVYKGRDQMLNRYVAIKVLKKQYKEDENFVRKFRSEAQAAAGLIHPNIVNVYDVGEDFLIKRRSVLRFRCAAVLAQHMHRELSIAISNRRILLFPRTER